MKTLEIYKIYKIIESLKEISCADEVPFFDISEDLDEIAQTVESLVVKVNKKQFSVFEVSLCRGSTASSMEEAVTQFIEWMQKSPLNYIYEVSNLKTGESSEIYFDEEGKVKGGEYE